MTTPLYTVGQGSSAQAIDRLIDILFPDAERILDATYGKGSFWKDSDRADLVTGIDVDPDRAKDLCADFTALPFADDSFDLCIFDPPYQWDMGKGKPSVMGARFGTYRSEQHARETIQAGVREVWRVSKLGILVKVQNHIHASRLVHMSRWVEDAVPSPLYDEHHLVRAAKIVDPKWGEQLSLYRNHTSFLAFRHDGPVHKRRRRQVVA